MSIISSKIGSFASITSRLYGISSVTINRSIHVSSVIHMRKLKESKHGDITIVEGEQIPTGKNNLLQPPEEAKSSNACPICRLGLKRLLYTDVLILSQFLDKNWRLMPIESTKLCQKSYNKVRYLIGIAQKCKILPRPPDYEVYGLWDRLNTYHDRFNRKRDNEMRVIQKKYW